MVSKGVKLLLVSTSLAPVLATLWFVELSQNWVWTAGIKYIITAFVLLVVCILLIQLSKSQLESFPVKITAVKSADREIVGFILVYLLPLINKSSVNLNPPALVFVAALFFGIVLTSHSYHFNPLLGFVDYHFYEATAEGGITYILVTRKSIRKCKDINRVVQISEYMILEA